MRSSPMAPQCGLIPLVLLGICALAGCQSLGIGIGSASPLTIEALGPMGPIAQLSVTQTTAVFRETDGTIDVIITDLTKEQLHDLAQGGASTPGVILHAHMFLKPHAGRTPIDFTASNSAFTMLVMASNDAGVYGGGGFLLPTAMNADRFAARTRHATLRLIGHTEAFVDQLGSGDLGGTIIAAHDPALTEDGLRLIAGAIQQIPQAK